MFYAYACKRMQKMRIIKIEIKIKKLIKIKRQNSEVFHTPKTRGKLKTSWKTKLKMWKTQI